MAVHQRKDGRWVVYYRQGGKTRYEYFGRGAAGEKAAFSRNQEMRDAGQIVQRAPQREPSPLFENLAAAYLEAKAGTSEPSTLTRQCVLLTGTILPRIGHLEASRMSLHTLDQYVSERLRSVKRTTVCREIGDIQAILNWAVDREYIQANPVARFKKPTRDDEVIQPATAGEVRAILANCPPHVARAILISYYTGLRPGRAELFALKWSAVDLEGKNILVIGARKGGPRWRRIPIHPDLLAMLEAWQRQDGEGEYIVSFQGQQVASIRKAYEKAKLKAGIKRRLPLYSLRHSFVTDLLNKGVDLKSVSELAGHSRPDTTMRHYQHTTSRTHRAAVESREGLAIPDNTALYCQIGTEKTSEK